jgi:hypothetical protein
MPFGDSRIRPLQPGDRAYLAHAATGIDDNQFTVAVKRIEKLCRLIDSDEVRPQVGTTLEHFDKPPAGLIVTKRAAHAHDHHWPTIVGQILRARIHCNY